MSWFARKRAPCRRFREDLRSLVEERPAALRVEELLERTGAELREHLSGCAACGALLRDALQARKLLRGAFAPALVPDAFTARVMAQIRAREEAPAAPAYPWAAVQTLASRVAWVSALVLLIASTWVYQHSASPSNPAVPPDTAADRFPEPTPQPSNLDEVLVSLAETQP